MLPFRVTVTVSTFNVVSYFYLYAPFYMNNVFDSVEESIHTKKRAQCLINVEINISKYTNKHLWLVLFFFLIYVWLLSMYVNLLSKVRERYSPDQCVIMSDNSDWFIKRFFSYTHTYEIRSSYIKPCCRYSYTITNITGKLVFKQEPNSMYLKKEHLIQIS